MGHYKKGKEGSIGTGIKSGYSTKKCYESHKPMPLGDGRVVYGGNCETPVIKGADVYIGFTGTLDYASKAYPWSRVVAFSFYLQDGGVPTDIKNFKKMVSWIQEQISAEKKVHLGCIGGHGRTGLVLSALVKEMLGDDDAISYVRKHYCEKAVETLAQVSFLKKHFGVKKQEPSKKAWSSPFYSDPSFYSGGFQSGKTLSKTLEIQHMPSALGKIWV